MPTFEKLPDTAQRGQFPWGDANEHDIKKANVVLGEFTTALDGYQSETRSDPFQAIVQFEIRSWLGHCPTQKPVYDAGRALGVAWDETMHTDYGEYNSGKRCFDVGFLGYLAFLRRSHLLPIGFSDFSTELTDMQQFSSTEIAGFAGGARDLMQYSHPRAYDITSALKDKLTTRYNIYNDQEQILLGSGMMLLYVMASTTRMEGYFKGDLRNEDAQVRAIDKLRRK